MSDVLDLLAGWLPAQRWYPGSAPQLELLGSYELDPVVEDAALRLITVAIVRDGATCATWQVPLVIRDIDAPLEALGYIGAVREHGDRAALVDGCHDQAFARALLRLIGDEGELVGAPGDAGGVRVYGQSMPGAQVGEFVRSRVLQGEQSNTSIICEHSGEGAAPLIVKVFRQLHDGDNPDVTLQTAIAAAGSRRVPPTFGQVAGVWMQDGAELSGHLAFAQEFFTGVEDAWRVTLRAAEGGEDFTDLARSLGEATAEVHAVLRRVMPSGEASDEDVELAVRQMWQRYETAREEVPQLAEVESAVERVYSAAGEARWPRLQRIHGDYHLGQVLAVPDRGWVLLDFEGEPLRPLAERSAPDVPLRDVAGMLRSFDYVAGALAVQTGRDDARPWADAARAAFIAGYDERLDREDAQDGIASIDDDDLAAVLAAYELDKAVYEAIYEARHRQGWLEIPVSAIRRICRV